MTNNVDAPSSELVAEFSAGYSFAFDDFQTDACRKLSAGRGVLVAAPTGSGKTVVGEFACWLALKQGTKCFYTTPIKALSNQKFHDLVARHGADNVGLLTGDTSLNSEAPIVVMTTEVLRNMIYARSHTLSGLSYVVMDEVHYLADRFRGPVWEEVILGLAESVQLVALSATVSNAEEFGEWLDEVRGGVDVVVSERRVVPLFQHVLVGRKLHDLFADEGPTALPGSSVRPEVNPELLRLAKAESRTMRDDSRRMRGRRVRGKIEARNRASGGPTVRPPRRDGAVEALHQQNLLPAIFFIFSRQGCDQAVRQLLGSDINLTNRAEREKLLRIADKHAGSLTAADKRALDWDTFIKALGRGIAAHHAGLLPVFKAIVEEGFVQGLVKVVFATETLALGINMPARTVVVEKLVKYNGETHAELTPGEYTQLTGRAGRRGIDVEGHAVVFWQPGMDPRSLAGLASRRTYPLRSSFAPTYNMAVNLVGSVGRNRARALLEQSFAQFQTDKKVVALARQAGRDETRAEQLWAEAQCDRGDFREYAELRDRIGALESEVARERKRDHRTEIIDSLQALEQGDVFWVPAGKHQGWAAVVVPARGHQPWPKVMTAGRQIVDLAEHDVNQPVAATSRVRVPRKFDVRSAADRRQLANSLQARAESLGDRPPKAGRPKADAELANEIADLRAQLRAHPCHSCPDREQHARAAEQALRLSQGHQRTRTKARARAQSIANRFDRICGVLDSLGYLDGDRQTERGAMLARIYNELDLLVTECIREGVFDGLEVPALAAVLSSLVYESRGDQQGRMHMMPDSASEQAQSKVRRIWRDLGMVERDNRVDRTEAPDIGFAEPAYQWASGAGLAEVLDASGLPAGDFVRWVRQVIDLAGQISKAPGAGQLAGTCQQLVHVMRRDIADFADPDDE
ncbi:DEAD/DEAH box helicase [Propionimicrobium sp. PCR01-08-3]|uniref:DEAD/DEAH box helicase n=1 Tax=Propionimicrobium sp. PCR01-08-3 TaxID=3052086 RepID=UPI00255CEDD0|nr:DEAD/DEAH box helicase [Propionimicrobium sp. PCR01-08-3]WIY83616.1 DEAD/DEAH box helicase [Propionimicrobium sp. PCR01-08-3]